MITNANLIKFSEYKEMVDKYKQKDAAICAVCLHSKEEHVFKVLESVAQDLKASDDTEGHILCLGFGQFTANPCTCNEFTIATWTESID
jgi:hypothetical protein